MAVDAFEQRLREVEEQRRAASLPIPPAPTTMPAITPVADLKNRTALQQEYTPEAAKMLYETPMTVRYGDRAWDLPSDDIRRPPGYFGSKGVNGWYQGNAKEIGDGRPEIFLTGQRGNREVGTTLPHEFAHKWYDKQLDDYGREAWSQMGREHASPDAFNHVAARMNYSDIPIDPYNELYAHNAEQGPGYIAPETRQMFYPGLYQNEVSPPNPPVPDWQRYRLQSDELPLGRYSAGMPFDTSHWVNERGVPSYYEDGGPTGVAREFPSRWDTPQFPSLRLMTETQAGW